MIREKIIVMPEPHIWDKNISTRIDYVGEIKEYMQEVKSIIEGETLDGSRVSVVWAGDIFHRGFNNVDEVLYWYTYFLELAGITEGRMYSVVGNHELSYYKGNPFWYLTSEMNSELLKGQRGLAYTPLGSINILNVTDRVEIGDRVVVSLGHYNTQPKPVEGKVNVLVTHNSIIEEEIGRVLRNKYDRDPLEHFIDYSYVRTNKPFEGFEYAFVGHMHKAYGLFTIDYGEDNIPDTRLRYLGSIGRTNSDEVQDNDRERVIPVLTIERSGEVIVEERTLTLRSRTETLDMGKMEESEKRYDKVKERKELEKVEYLLGSPIDTVRKSLSKYPALLVWLDDSLTDKVPDFIIGLQNEVYEGRNEKWN